MKKFKLWIQITYGLAWRMIILLLAYIGAVELYFTLR